MTGLRIAGIERESIVDGPGFRYAVFTQGCPHRCPGCHNPMSHSRFGGQEADISRLASGLDSPLLEGLTLTGGEPFMQAQALLPLAAAARARRLSVWIYSGYTFEQLISGPAVWKALLGQADVLVDGPFILSQRTFSLPWRGSLNQRLIDAPASMQAGRAVLYKDI